jgi:hypothetical protein
MADEIVWVSRAPMDSTLSKTVKGNEGSGDRGRRRALSGDASGR